MSYYISSDHGGYKLKQEIIEYLKQKNINIEDLGPFEHDPNDDYVDYAVLLCQKIQQNKDSLGILICRSGIGMCITANKFKGVYAGLCFTPQHAKSGREHNNINVLCLDSDYSDHQEVFKIVDQFISTSTSLEERHVRRRNKITNLENQIFK